MPPPWYMAFIWAGNGCWKLPLAMHPTPPGRINKERGLPLTHSPHLLTLIDRYQGGSEGSLGSHVNWPHSHLMGNSPIPQAWAGCQLPPRPVHSGKTVEERRSAGGTSDQLIKSMLSRLTQSLVNRRIKTYPLPPPTSTLYPWGSLQPSSILVCWGRTWSWWGLSKAETVPPHWLLRVLKLILFQFGERDGESLHLTSGAEESGWGNGVSEDLRKRVDELPPKGCGTWE